jgi:hypothetical protein
MRKMRTYGGKMQVGKSPVFLMQASWMVVLFLSALSLMTLLSTAGCENAGPCSSLLYKCEDNKIMQCNADGKQEVWSVYQDCSPGQCLTIVRSVECDYSSSDGGGDGGGKADAGNDGGGIWKVSPPTFSHPGGTYSAPLDVVISITTPGAVIIFTTDGTEPNFSSSLVYSAPVHISVTTILKALGHAPGLIDSDVQSAVYTIEGGGGDAGMDAGTDAGADAGTCMPDGGSYSIGGTLSGLGASKSVTIKNNTSDYLSPIANGNFTFNEKLQCGATYAVKIVIQPNGQTCVLANESGTVTKDVTDVTVTCSDTK